MSRRRLKELAADMVEVLSTPDPDRPEVEPMSREEAQRLVAYMIAGYTLMLVAGHLEVAASDVRRWIEET